MQTPRSRGPRRFFRVVIFLAVVTLVSALGSAFLPSVDRVALAQDGQALGDALILAGPGGQYGILTVAPAGAVMSVDGDPVDGYYPVTYDGISGWTSTGLLQVADGGGNDGGGNGGGGDRDRGTTNEVGNGGVETVTADPVYSDGGAPVAAAPAEPVTGGTYGPGGGGYSEEQIVDIIHEAADNYGQSRSDMLRVARCESGLDPNAVGGGGAWHGLFQFVPSTFAKTPYGQYDIYDPWANANAAAWMWSEGQKSAWVCQ
ncbi:MAG TPA: transglycosylase SLT domain-containing protein [Thermomicrobiales bacterium]|nr:transglycosylase SLT domain-containing protein [Thermomicrobiales bacterium]